MAAAISRAPTNQEPDLTNELTALSLESTLRRQQSREKSVQIREILTDARYHATRAGKHLLNWVLLLPTDLALSFSKGFHNAPKLYHDPMVQETPTVRGVKGGFRAAGTVSFFFSFRAYGVVWSLLTVCRSLRRNSARASRVSSSNPNTDEKRAGQRG
jgi:hypothetical protein